MKKAYSLLMNEGGSLIVFTLMVLCLLTIVGLVAIRTANTEIEIAGTELQYQRNFYLAEGAAMEAVHKLDADNTMNGNDNGDLDWIEMTPGLIDNNTIDDYFAGTEGSPVVVTPGTYTLDADASFIATYVRLAEGSSLDVNKTKLHDLAIYGRSEKSGFAEVIIGYRKAF